MEALNLNGLVVGKLGDKILVAVTMDEYMDALPLVQVRSDDPPALLTPVNATPAISACPIHARLGAGRPAGKATKAQRRFNKWTERKPKPDKGEGAKLAQRLCPYCKTTYTPVRCDQTNCLAPRCKHAKAEAYAESRRKPRRAKGKAGRASLPSGKPAAPAAAAGSPRMTKEQRLAQIREVARRVEARHAGEGTSLRSTVADTPPELADAARAADEG